MPDGREVLPDVLCDVEQRVHREAESGEDEDVDEEEARHVADDDVLEHDGQ